MYAPKQHQNRKPWRHRLGMMTRAEKRAWRSVHSLHEIGALMAQWLTGGIASRPGYQPGYGPDVETMPLIPVLAAANRAGFVTDCSQPGVTESAGYDGATWAQRAAVSGWVDNDLSMGLATNARQRGLWAVTHTPNEARRSPSPRSNDITVTTRNGQPVTGVGLLRSRRSVATCFIECSDVATNSLCSAAQISIVDPHWEPSEVLWTVLSNWATSYQQ